MAPPLGVQAVALITGAGSGIGRDVARQLAQVGYRLALAGRREQALRETLHLAGRPDDAAFPVDLEDPATAVKLVDDVVAQFGRVDAIINNAGWSPSATIAQTTPDITRRVFSLNAEAPTLIIARAWPILVRQAKAEGSGAVIVNTSSIATVDPFPMLYAYAAAKSAVNTLAKSVAKEGKALGIRAYSVAPGAVETELLRSLLPATALPSSKTLRPEAVAQVIVDCVLGRRAEASGSTILLPSL